MNSIGLNGFGRIGRRLLRIMDDTQRAKVVAINEIADARTLAHLFKNDSTHGRFDGNVEGDDGSITINGHPIRILNETSPRHLPWGDLGVETVVESTGYLRGPGENAQHLANGAKIVVATGLIRGSDLILVRGVNESDHDPDQHRLISIGAGLTQLATPLLKVIHEQFGIERGNITALMAMSPDQAVLDRPHPSRDLRRGRTASANIVPTDLAYAAPSIGRVIPDLRGKITAEIGYRIPIPCGYLAEIHLELRGAGGILEVNNLLREAAEGALREVLEYTEEPIVSSDIVGNPRACVVDGSLTSGEGTRIMLVAWQDNETACAQAVLNALGLAASRP